MKTIISCVYQTKNHCRLFRKECDRDYSPDHFPSNLDCEYFNPIKIRVIEVAEPEPTIFKRKRELQGGRR